MTTEEGKKPYQMVTKAEIDTLEQAMRSKVTGPWFDVMRKLLAERGVYRGIALAGVEKMSGGPLTKQLTEAVDETAIRLLSSREGEGEGA